MATIPGNSLQRRLHEIEKLHQKPAYGTQKKLIGRLLGVIDKDNKDIPQELYLAITNSPGTLYGYVEIEGFRKKLYLPFQENAEVIYSLYGNAEQLIGRRVFILYYDHNISNGEIVLNFHSQENLIDTSASIAVFNIGGVL